MEHEDNAQFDNFLQNRLTESLQNAGSAGNAADVAAELVPNIGPKSGEHDGEHDDDEEWKYIKEVQQSEKQQQQEQFYGEKFNDVDVDADVAFGVGVGNGIGKTAVGNGNGVDNSGDAYMSLGMDLSLGNGVGSAAGFRAYAADIAAPEEEDVEVIKNDGDLSTNSNTTTTSTTGEVEPPLQPTLPELQQLQLHQDEADEEEDEPSSVATTYGTSSLSEQHQDPEQLVAEPLAAVEPFDNKENADPTSLDLDQEPHSQLNPNAVEFVPHFSSQPSSPAPASNVDPMQTLGRQLIADDLVAESPRKGARDMDIALPDEREFDNEAAQRPHELEQEDDTFPDNTDQLQLQNGASVVYEQQQQPNIDHGPETSVDLDADLESPVQTHQSELDLNLVNQEENDIMKRSMYGVAISNAPIEDILNSVQPLPQQTPVDEPLKEKELLNVEEKELVSQSPSIEELHQHLQQQPLDPMQESFYLEHTSSDAFAQQIQDHEQEQSLLLDTSAPMFSPLEDLPHHAETITETISATAKTLDLRPEQADIVDITPSPLSASTEEKHLVEETKEQQEQHAILDLDEPKDLLLDNVQIIQSAGPPSQVEYADYNTATGYDVVHSEYENETALISNPFADDQLLGSGDAHVEFMPQQQELQPEPYQELFQEQVNREQQLYQEQEQHQQLYQEEPLKLELHFKEQFPSQEELQEQPHQHVEEQYLAQEFVEEQKEEPAPKQESQPNYNELLLQDEPIKETHVHQLNAEAAPFTNGVVSHAFTEPQLESRHEEPVLAVAAHSEPQEEELSIVPQQVVDQLLEQHVEPVHPETPVEIVASSEPVEPVVAKEEEAPVAEIAVAVVAAAAAVGAVAATAVVAANKAKIKVSPADAAKKPTPKTTTSSTAIAAKAKPAAAPITKKTSATTTAGAPKAAAARPRTAPSVGATKAASSTAVATSTAAAKPTGSASARKPLAASNATSKPAPRTLSARPATAPASKPAASGLSSKPAPAATARGTATATARKSATSTATTGTTSQIRSRLQVTASSNSGSGSTPAAKPKVPSPRSTMASTLRKSAPVTSSASARSPTKPLTNGVAKSSTVNGSSSTTTTTSTTRVKSATGSSSGSASNTTTTTTITKTFTARPAPKFTHSTTTTGSASSARRPASSTASGTLGASTTMAQRKVSPLKSASSSPLKPKAKETAKTSPAVGLKAGKSLGNTTTPGKSATAVKSAPAAANEPAPALIEPETKQEPLSQNGNGLHDVLEAAEEALPNLESQQPQQLDDPALYSFVESRGDF